MPNYQALIEVDLEADNEVDAQHQAGRLVAQICGESFCECARIQLIVQHGVAEYEETVPPTLCEMPLCSENALYEGWMRAKNATPVNVNQRRMVCENHRSLLIGAQKEKAWPSKTAQTPSGPVFMGYCDLNEED